jgi:hypothetical protein
MVTYTVTDSSPAHPINHILRHPGNLLPPGTRAAAEACNTWWCRLQATRMKLVHMRLQHMFMRFHQYHSFLYSSLHPHSASAHAVARASAVNTSMPQTQAKGFAHHITVSTQVQGLRSQEIFQAMWSQGTSSTN